MTLTKQDLSAIKSIVQSEIKPVGNDISVLKKDMKKVRNDLKTTINFFDKEHLRLKKFTTGIANEIGYPVIPNL